MRRHAAPHQINCRRAPACFSQWFFPIYAARGPPDAGRAKSVRTQLGFQRGRVVAVDDPARGLVVEAATTEGGEVALAPLCPVVGAAPQSKRPEPAAPRLAPGGAQPQVVAFLKLPGQPRLAEPGRDRLGAQKIGKATWRESVGQK